MERRFDPVLEAALASCEVPESLSGLLPERFRSLAEPFGDLLASDSKRYDFHAILEGLAAKGRKNLESIAYAHDSDRQMYQVFVGQRDWDHQPMLDLIAQQVGK
ncbi:MAG: hypothetical protein FWH27_10115 [Planctomycetaceae bacterium]|nr:hypothetical protein [Planctomycetaceae bacterium]